MRFGYPIGPYVKNVCFRSPLCFVLWQLHPSNNIYGRRNISHLPEKYFKIEQHMWSKFLFWKYSTPLKFDTYIVATRLWSLNQSTFLLVHKARLLVKNENRELNGENCRPKWAATKMCFSCVSIWKIIPKYF